MSWICPYCGYTNKIDPLNSRHKPDCGGCDERYEVPEVLLKRKTEEMQQLKVNLHAAQLANDACRARIEHLKTELADEQSDLEKARCEYSGIFKALTKWENTKVYGLTDEIDKAAKAALDIHQAKLPFEVPA